MRGVPKSDTVPEPVLPVLETPRVLPYPCGTLLVALSQNVLTRPDDEEMHSLSCSIIEDFTSTSAEYRLRSYSSAELSMGQAKIWQGGLTKMKCQPCFGGSPFSGVRKGKSLSLIT